MDNSTEDGKETKIIFKKPKNLNNLKTKIKTSTFQDDQNENDDDNDDGSIDWSTLNDLKEWRKAKKRQHDGINVNDLMKVSKKDNQSGGGSKKTFGLTDAETLASELDLGNTFSIETNRRDEDSELMKYVEEELAKRRKSNAKECSESSVKSSTSSQQDSYKDLLMKTLPENLFKLISETKNKSEEMLPSHMLSGIPEVDLGIEERIKNIEKTETARNKLIEKRMQQDIQKREDDNLLPKNLSLAPKNIASCFNNRNNLLSYQSANIRFQTNNISSENENLMSHFIQNEEKRINSNRSHQNENRQQPIQYEIEPVVVIGDEPQKVRLPKPIDKDNRLPGKDKPSDNYLFEKFKKNLKKR
ncbi:hypothetical protein SSS_07377 [Sarcoptes scabiei]|uniref:C9orf78-like protein n=1 Tax=Sarcoptes scabiei TaxID=52283 RepID=A0A132A7X2_SARSC|nr:hypothetical protein SSS_07377 [Sarcoptes scabiei]KPM07076.1 C9orf78-like protein [Sarcoptes scabiei]